MWCICCNRSLKCSVPASKNYPDWKECTKVALYFRCNKEEHTTAYQQHRFIRRERKLRHGKNIRCRLKYLNFFNKWIGGKMKIWLEKPAVNISKLMDGENEKQARQRTCMLTWKTSVRFVLVIYRKQSMEIKITEYVMCR